MGWKSAEKPLTSHHSSACNGDWIYLPSAAQEQPLFFGSAPAAPACAFQLCSAGGTPLDMDMYSTHQASAELGIAAPALQPGEESIAPQPSLHFNHPQKVKISIF